jgi:hypothetical protein
MDKQLMMDVLQEARELLIVIDAAIAFHIKNNDNYKYLPVLQNLKIGLLNFAQTVLEFEKGNFNQQNTLN